MCSSCQWENVENSRSDSQSIDVALGDVGNFAGSPVGQVFRTQRRNPPEVTEFWQTSKSLESLKLTFFNCSIQLLGRVTG